jgi:hypothetical protein
MRPIDNLVAKFELHSAHNNLRKKVIQGLYNVAVKVLLVIMNAWIRQTLLLFAPYVAE